MKNDYIPKSKRSKKVKKATDVQQRGTWGVLRPVTKTIPNKKAYDRKAKWKEED